MSKTPQRPTVGRIVHVFPGSIEALSDNKRISENGAPFIPAIVTQVFPNSWGHPNYTGVNLVAVNDNGINISLKSLQHKSTAVEGAPYWDWPARD